MEATTKTEKELEDIFEYALELGLNELGEFGIHIDFMTADFLLIKETIPANAASKLHIMEVLRHSMRVNFVDLTSEGIWSRSISLQDVHERMALVPENILREMDYGYGNSKSAQIILQYVIYGEILFY